VLYWHNFRLQSFVCLVLHFSVLHFRSQFCIFQPLFSGASITLPPFSVKPTYLNLKPVHTVEKSATVAEFGDCRRCLAVFCDSRTSLRQCGQGFTLLAGPNCSVLSFYMRVFCTLLSAVNHLTILSRIAFACFWFLLVTAVVHGCASSEHITAQA